jgi:hypothetical protein
MADDATDTAFGFILFILFLALLGYAAGGVSSSSSTAGTSGGTSRSLPSLEGNSVSSCTGTLGPNETVANVNLKVYVDPMDAGQKCATATTASAGTLRVTLAYTADPDQMVSKTDSCPPGQTCTVSVQVNGTENFCVSAVAEILGTASKVIIRKVVEPCSMAVPAMQPVPGSDHKEIEEGY